MVDMHIHTIYSDKNDKLEDVLKQCKKLKLEYIVNNAKIIKKLDCNMM